MRLQMANNKTKTNKKRTHRMQRDFRRTKDKKFELKILELNKKLAML